MNEVNYVAKITLRNTCPGTAPAAPAAGGL